MNNYQRMSAGVYRGPNGALIHSTTRPMNQPAPVMHAQPMPQAPMQQPVGQYPAEGQPMAPQMPMRQPGQNIDPGFNIGQQIPQRQAGQNIDPGFNMGQQMPFANNNLQMNNPMGQQYNQQLQAANQAQAFQNRSGIAQSAMQNISGGMMAPKY